MHKSLFSLAVFFALLSPTVALAFTNPTVAPPGGNITAPVNVGTVNQVKNANLSVNGLAVFGNTILSGAEDIIRYLNWGTISGDTGYGIRNNPDGILQFKNRGGPWQSLQAAGFGAWAPSGNNIYNTNTGNVGIGTTGPVIKLAIGDSDTGLHWTGDGLLHIYSNNVNAMSIRNDKVGIGTTNPIGTLAVENGAGTATICLNGVCTTSLGGATGTTGYTGNFGVQAQAYPKVAEASIHVYGYFIVSPTFRAELANGLITNLAPMGGLATIDDPRCSINRAYCIGNGVNAPATARLICTSMGYTLFDYYTTFEGGVYSSGETGTMTGGTGGCTSSCRAIRKVICIIP